MDGTSYELWAIFATLIIGQGAMARWLVGIMRRDRQDSQQRDEVLHKRINDVKDEYVRRDDLDQRLKRIEDQQERTLATIDRVHERIDAFLAAGKPPPEGR